jgi:sigma-B regulation protein RsbU (phosphoserine phosphatase)
VLALNNAVYRITKGDKYITLFVAELDIKNKRLQYINAGNYPPFMKMNDEMLRLDRGCTVIGAFQSLPFIEMGEIPLSGSGLILTFTDGLTDLQNEEGEYFEDEDILKVFQENSVASASVFNEKLQKRMDEFRGSREFTDDIAVLTCKFDVLVRDIQ